MSIDLAIALSHWDSVMPQISEFHASVKIFMASKNLSQMYPPTCTLGWVSSAMLRHPFVSTVLEIA